MDKPKVYLVDWIDSTVDDKWREAVPLTPARCQSIGYLLENNKTYVTLALSRDKDPSYTPFGMRISIPAGAIVQKRRINLKL